MTRFLLAAAAALLAAGTAHAQQISAANPQTVVNALQSAGYKALLAKDEDGDPKIESAAGGGKFVILFFGCTNGVRCTSIQFLAGWSRKDKPALARINEWNREFRIGKAYTDEEDDPILKWDMGLETAIPEKAFVESLNLWTSSMGRFALFIDEPEKPAAK